jgi:hypothetical protein
VNRVAGGRIDVRIASPDTSRHLALYKADFLRLVAEREPDAASFVYFDPDIVVKCEWAFVERWAARGIAAVADLKGSPMPWSSPIRSDWVELGDQLGVPVPHSTGSLDVYCNAGFVGLRRDCFGFLDLWGALIDAAVAARGDWTPPLVRRPAGSGRDQDLFNLALMGWAHKAALMGPEAMDFAPGGGVFSHGAGIRPKPWDGGYVRRALGGRPPGRYVREYLRHRGGPFDPLPGWRMRRATLAYELARAVGAVVRRRDD